MSTDSPSPEEPQLPSAPPLSGSDMNDVQPQSNRMLLVGLGCGFLLYAIAFVLAILPGPTAAGSYSEGYWAIALLVFMLGVSALLLVAGLILVFRARSRKLGAGLLISIAVGLFVDSGACIALLATTAG